MLEEGREEEKGERNHPPPFSPSSSSNHSPRKVSLSAFDDCLEESIRWSNHRVFADAFLPVLDRLMKGIDRGEHDEMRMRRSKAMKTKKWLGQQGMKAHEEDAKIQGSSSKEGFNAVMM